MASSRQSFTVTGAVLSRLILACVILAWVILGGSMLGCELIKYSPHQDDLPSSAKNLNAKNIARIQATTPSETLRIAVVSDTQNHYDETQAFVDTINARDDVDFVIHNGDITHFGITQEYQWMHEIFAELDVPYLAVIGNHDLLANGGMLYDQVYGERNFSFVHAGTKFIFIDNNSRQYDNPGDVPNLDWLDEELSASDAFDRAIVVGHVPPDHPTFDSELVEPYAMMLEESGIVPLALYGHEHDYSVQQPYGEVVHLVSASAENRRYTLVTLFEDGVEFEKVDF